jgi:NADPH-dependent 2,4-dienoyl-CoA reductase/sulfur reductase-like enzyme
MSTGGIVVVGGGLAAAKAVEELRAQGHDGRISLVAAEPHLPYERPPLSKGLLLGKDAPDSVFVHDRDWYDVHDVDLHLATPALRIDREGHRVVIDGGALDYDRLLLATGATPRRLGALDPIEVPVLTLRTVEDSLTLKERLGGRVLIVGAGWIGLEVAAAAREAGAEVTVVETAELPLLAVLGPQVAPLFADLHREHGVDLRLGAGIVTVDGAGVSLTDGHRVEPDLVVVGIGAVPDDHLAAEAGLGTDNGILVDARLRTSDPAIWAAGDVARHDHPTLGRLRVEHWDNAIEQGRHAARSMLGDVTAYSRLPYFFTDQYDLGMEYVGHASGTDDVIVRGDLGNREITAFWVRDDTVVAGMHVNEWDATDHLRRIVGQPLDPRLGDVTVDLADLGERPAS